MNRYFLVDLCFLIVKSPKLEVANTRLLHQQVRIMLNMEVCLYSEEEMSEVTGCHLLRQTSFP